MAQSQSEVSELICDGCGAKDVHMEPVTVMTHERGAIYLDMCLPCLGTWTRILIDDQPVHQRQSIVDRIWARARKHG